MAARFHANGYSFETIFDRLQAAGISWKFYVQNYEPSINYRTLTGDAQDSQTIWVPLVDFDRFIETPELASRIVDIGEYRQDLADGTLPAVSFMVPSGASEHPPGDVAIGQVYGASQVTALIQSTSWPTSAFVLSWDDWGGWYDHVIPPRVDANGYGLRVPALMVSPFSTTGRIDSTPYDFTSILRFIEDNWDLQPLTARDAAANSIAAAFDFNSSPRSPRLPGPTYPSGVSVSPSARLALLAVYGLIVLGVPAGSFLAWRRRPANLRSTPVAGIRPALIDTESPTAAAGLTASAAAALAATTIGASGPAVPAASRGRLLRTMPITAPSPFPARPRPVDPPAAIPTRPTRTASAGRLPAQGGAVASVPQKLATADASAAPQLTRPTKIVTAAAASSEPGARKRKRKGATPAATKPSVPSRRIDADAEQTSGTATDPKVGRAEKPSPTPSAEPGRGTKPVVDATASTDIEATTPGAVAPGSKRRRRRRTSVAAAGSPSDSSPREQRSTAAPLDIDGQEAAQSSPERSAELGSRPPKPTNS